ncbi:aminoglycoside phosphotransferase family protein [Aliiroseovarius sp. 2305UL8-7]|uniref:aminoglycoside phosphotransferase family protein n=1 Tax=Aliiroseovarius conchicola TaxID=3121637 RepID=UPI0035280797
MTDFLQQSGWSNAARVPLAGDASARQYYRLTRPKTRQSAILMDAPPASVGSMDTFVSVAGYLEQIGLSAPKIIDRDIKQGFLLLEDLGDSVFDRVITNYEQAEHELYEAAIDVIAHLHKYQNGALPLYGAGQMAEATDLAFLHYRAEPLGELDGGANELISDLRHRLSQLAGYSYVSLRDFHAQNLIWLPERSGTARVGLLDFQDAVLTHPAYDLMSLLRDARRDVSPGLAGHLMERFCQINGYNQTSFEAEAALISAQRNLRILGIFARLSRLQGKTHYVDLIPRVWANLQKDLAHPSLDMLKKALAHALPSPTPDFLAKLREPCQTPQ